MSVESNSAKPVDSLVVARFSGISTFMRLPYVPEGTGLDIGMVGVPFDFPTNRGGTRHGPSQVREMSRLIRRFPSSGGESPFDQCEIADMGDAPFNPLNPQSAVEDTSAFFAEMANKGIVPVACGGDHAVSYFVLRGIVRDGPIGFIQFDAHPDTSEELYGDRYNHGTLLTRGVQEGLIDPARTVTVGLRGTRFSRQDRDFNAEHGMRVIDFDEFEALGRQGVIDEICRVVGKGPCYITFDIDALDSAFVPGTGSPEPGGLTMRDAQVVLRGLQGLNIVGADMCEVSPPLDPQGITALNGANLLFELLCITAPAVRRRKSR
ncbi:agmatinase [Rhizobium ruizarguesonis]|uniref:agmatinase n=1 Tax=Rhizobium TaxID=379 RepID=UPI0013BF1462|nr:agmatinase [Rhizobium ruizarguesonis]MBY5828610.1 agmatinase [Rhizobium leguminosarum]MBY5856347.1 agmatinase [Rhizobium leguminosarum]NEI96512.1 agmatinase [Rhizobium ruizarguesonis]NEJ33865.1 agmatinase [Rhizobium ruizarguesonis]